MILDSPLNKAGKVKEIYVHTAKNVLIQVNPKVVIGRGGGGEGCMLRILTKMDSVRLDFSAYGTFAHQPRPQVHMQWSQGGVPHSISRPEA